MKSLLGMLLGENPVEKYDPKKFTAVSPKAPLPPPKRAVPEAPQRFEAPQRTQTFQVAPRPPRAEAPQAPPVQKLYGSGNDMDHNPSAQAEPSPLGCWLVSQPGVMVPVRQNLKVDTIPLQARVAIASACVAPMGCGSAALYDPESFMSPIETSQPVIATGSLINTYTGEVSDLFEDAMPPPDNGRDAGDAVRERKQAQRRLMAAEGNVTAAHHKREQQNPIQPGDAGVATQLANFQINADVATESNERACRDLFFNRNELAPTELEMTRNPFGFEGYNNRVRINPYMLPTQNLDEKGWTSNATLLPGGDTRPKNLKTKLRKERPRTDYLGQATGIQPGEDGRADVRRSQAARDEEGLTEANRCVNAQALYGDAAAVSSAQVRLSRDRSEGKPHSGVLSSSLEGPSVVTAASVLGSLGYRGQQREVALVNAAVEGRGSTLVGAAQQSLSKRDDQKSSPNQQRGVENLQLASAAGAAAHRSALRADASDAASNRAVDLGGTSSAFTGSEQRTSSRVEGASMQARGVSSETAGASTLSAQRQSLGERDAQTVDPVSLFSSLTGFDGAGLAMMQRQFLGGGDDFDVGGAARRGDASVQAGRVDVSASDAHTPSQLTLDRPGDVAPQNGSRIDVSSHSVRRQDLYGDGAKRDVLGPLASDMTHAQTQRAATKVALDKRGGGLFLQSGNTAAGAHGAFGETVLRTGVSEKLAERAAAPHLNGGYSERNSTVSARNARGEVLSGRTDNFKVGADADFHKRSEPAAREWKNELLTKPLVRRSVGNEGQRCSIATREPRRERVAKSPFRGHALKERGGLTSFLQEPTESRYEPEDE